MSAFCCLKSSPQVDNSIASSSQRNGRARNSIRKDRNEMDLLLMNKQMSYDVSEIGGPRSTN
jgi:hypothetical protein